MTDDPQTDALQTQGSRMEEARPIRADAGAFGLRLDRARLERRLAALPATAPVVVMIHGWRYAPGFARDCPHGSILSLDPPTDDRRAVSWPRHLGLDGRSALGIALGWNAKCDPWRAHLRAGRTGPALAEIALTVHEMSGRRVQVVAHSMGARVSLSALPLLPAGLIERIILLAAAETRGRALAALDTPAGRTVEVVNVTTRENDLFDACFEWGIHLGLSTSIGQGLGRSRPNWHDLWIDQPRTLSALASLGHALPDPPRRICHWSPYLRPGTIALYRALIEGRLSAQNLPVHRPGRRWSRLILGARGMDLGSGLPAA
ncbi:hypothetical protein [Rhodobacter calidifons]|uniref:Alpha/beta hydrolase family protein DUF900 n=1 Tax=Rhodobacter calidifons TaxID=2715277 RepID=A0ABX0G5Z6_9RHOB|nr:hypothetical protein [Rhodobacter calidifons]NHB76697.1 hypothetical protein [Rhodobacter calidifons]